MPVRTSLALLLAACGPGPDPCGPCETAQQHMIEKISANDCNPNFMQEAVDSILEECADLELERGDDVFQLDAYKLIGVIHETCQAGKIPFPQCVASPKASVQVEFTVDEALFTTYPSGFVVIPDTSTPGVSMNGYAPDLEGPGPTLLNAALPQVTEGTTLSFEVNSLEGYFVPETTYEASFSIRQSAPAFDLPLRRLHLTEDADGLILQPTGW